MSILLGALSIRSFRVGYPGVRAQLKSITGQTSGLTERTGEHTANH